MAKTKNYSVRFDEELFNTYPIKDKTGQKVISFLECFYLKQKDGNIKKESEIKIKDVTKPTNVVKPFEQPKTNYTIEIDNSEIERQIKEWQNKKCPSYMNLQSFKNMQGNEIKKLESQLK